MIEAEALLSQLAAGRVYLSGDGERLRYRVNGGSLDPALAAELKAVKADLSTVLAGHNGAYVLLSPLSANQESLYFSHQLDPNSTAYDLAISVLVTGPVDKLRFLSALEALLTVYPCLGAIYKTVHLAGRTLPCQMIPAAGDANISLDEQSARDVDEALEIAQDFYDVPLRLGTGPNIRCLLIKIPTGETGVVLKFPHASADGWSMGRIARELSKLYSASTDAAMYAPLYTDFVVDQRQRRFDEGIAFFRRQLADCPPDIRLRPGVEPVPAANGVRVMSGDTLFFDISQAGRERIESMAVQLGASAPMLLLTVMQRLLAAANPGEKLAVGLPTLGGRSARFLDTPGYFVNPLPIVCSPATAAAPFAAHLALTAKEVQQALAYRELPFSQMVRALSLDRGLAQAPVFQVMFNFLQRAVLGDVIDWLYPWPEPLGRAFCGLPSQPLPVFQQEGQFDLTLEIIDNGHSYMGLLKYSPDRLSEEQAQAWVEDYLALLQEELAAQAS